MVVHASPVPADPVKFIFADGATYEGFVESGKRHGHGVYVSTDGSRYEGAWQADVMQGPGTVSLSFLP